MRDAARKKHEVDFNERPFIAIWEATQACDLACVHRLASAQPLRSAFELSKGEGDTFSGFPKALRWAGVHSESARSGGLPCRSGFRGRPPFPGTQGALRALFERLRELHNHPSYTQHGYYLSGRPSHR